MKAHGLRLRSVIIACLLLSCVAVASLSFEMNAAHAGVEFETRCGWFDNPTPSNISLYDRDGEWIIGVQGSYQVEGDWEWPEFKPKQWVHTNGGDYGYGCACLQLRVDRQSSRVLEIKSVRPRPLAVCRKDKSLRKWKSVLE